jgi:hypothetical protein
MYADFIRCCSEIAAKVMSWGRLPDEKSGYSPFSVYRFLTHLI